MNWFVGEIADAVKQSKQKNSIFVVFVKGNDESSQMMSDYINSANVCQKLASEDFVSIKIDVPSDAYTQFATIYKMVPVPSLFFIGKAGTPLEIVSASIKDADKLEMTINKVLLLSGRRTVNNLDGTTSDFIAAEQSADAAAISNLTNDARQSEPADLPSTAAKKATDFIAAEQHAVNAAESAKSNAVDAIAVTSDTKQSDLVDAPVVDKTTGLNATDAVTKTAAAATDNNKQASDALAASKVVDKESDGPSTSQQKRKPSTQKQPIDTNADAAFLKHMRSTQEAIRLEKMAKQAERDRIRAQIAADRLEMAHKYNMSANMSTPTATTKPQLTSETNKIDLNGVVRLQFRFPTGETKAHNFVATDTLSVVRTHVHTEFMIGSGIKDFDLATTYPRRILLPELDEQTLAELSLVPSAVILVINKGGSNQNAVLSDKGGIYNMLTLLVSTMVKPIYALFAYFRTFVGFRNEDGNNVTVAAAAAARQHHSDQLLTSEQSEKRSNRNYGTAHRSGYVNDSADTASTSQSNNDTNSQLRFRGNTPNVHRLADNRKDSDDENATWNGNSTQQQ